MNMPKRFLLAVLLLGPLVGVLGGSIATGCAASQTGGFEVADATSRTADSDSGLLLDDAGGSQKPIASLTIDPPTAALEVVNGVIVTQKFNATIHYTDNTTLTVNNAVWSVSNASVGAIDAHGSYTPRGSQGGIVTVTAAAVSKRATAQLTVRIHVIENSANASAATQTMLKAAQTQDATVRWLYPYDNTVFPRGINAPRLMWSNAGMSDVYYVRLFNPTYEYESFSSVPPPSRFAMTPQTWNDFTNSTRAATDLTVARFDGMSASRLVHQTWWIADGSMRGTIYYWAMNLGRVVRVKPGANAPDDFLAGLVVNGTAQKCPSCHTVSADGSSLIMNVSTSDWPSEESMNYSLNNASSTYYGLHVDTGASAWAQAAVTPDGKTLVQNFAPLRGSPPAVEGAFDSATAAKLPNSGFDGLRPWMPAFSPDNKVFVYVQEGGGDLHAMDWDGTHASNDRLVVAKGGDASVGSIQFPSASPDHKWVIYHRGPALGSLGIPGNLYLAPTDGSGPEIRLGNLNGDGYPFAAGARDQNLNFEPTFAPVAAGGYFWLVFHSRRTYGNELTGPAYEGEWRGTKQLWVAAIDQSPAAGKDPSHPAFWLPGQDLTTLNMRGYWALDPCKANGQVCASGTECCGGFCDGAGDGGAATCGSNAPSSCANNGDRCKTTADCCDEAAGVTCINSVCSEPTPK